MPSKVEETTPAFGDPSSEGNEEVAEVCTPSVAEGLTMPTGAFVSASLDEQFLSGVEELTPSRFACHPSA